MCFYRFSLLVADAALRCTVCLHPGYIPGCRYAAIFRHGLTVTVLRPWYTFDVYCYSPVVFQSLLSQSDIDEQLLGGDDEEAGDNGEQGNSHIVTIPDCGGVCTLDFTKAAYVLSVGAQLRGARWRVCVRFFVIGRAAWRSAWLPPPLPLRISIAAMYSGRELRVALVLLTQRSV